MKRAIIKELQKRLKNHHTAVGEQIFSLQCSEDDFVGVFRTHITTLFSMRHPFNFVILKEKRHLMKLDKFWVIKVGESVIMGKDN